MLPSSQMAIQLTLLLISCSLYSMYSSSSSSSFSTSSLALLVLVISTCLSLLFSNLRQLIRASSHKAKPLPSMEAVHQEKNTVPQDEVADEAPEDLTGSLSEYSDCPVSEECNEEGSMSDNDDDDDDDESLIEISLVDGHYVGQGGQCAWKEQDLLAEFLPDLVLDKRDFMDILSEISEEDNLIEIDIARGSIKCSNFSIKA